MYALIIENEKEIQPTRNATPAMGVMTPSHFRPVIANR